MFNLPQIKFTLGSFAIKAYVEYVQYVEGVYDASSGAVAEHAHAEGKPAAHEPK